MEMTALCNDAMERSFLNMKMINKASLIAALTAFAAGTSLSADITGNKAENNDGVHTAIVSGSLDDTTYTSFVKYIAQHKNIHTIVFKDCLGGVVSTGFAIASLIKQNRYQTIAEGKVYSSCAYAFLAGKKRIFDKRSSQNLVMLHASRNIIEGTGIAERMNPFIMQLLREFTENKIPESLFSLIQSSTGKSQGVVFINENMWWMHRYETRYCSGAENGELEKCGVINSDDPKIYGITAGESEQ